MDREDLLVGKEEDQSTEANDQRYESGGRSPRMSDTTPRKSNGSRSRAADEDYITTRKCALAQITEERGLICAYIQSMRPSFSFRDPGGVLSLRKENTKIAARPLVGKFISMK